VRRAAVIAAAALLAGAAAATMLHGRHGEDVIGSRSVEYEPREPREPPERSTDTAPRDWPMYGRTAARLRADEASPLRPPYRVLWAFEGGSLLEFPPALADGRLYLPTFRGLLYALDPRTGRVLWRRASGRCTSATPAFAEGLVYETFLLRSPRCKRDASGGELVAFEAATGHVRWRVTLPPTESSPLVADGLVVIGDWSGAVSAFDAHTGALRWRFHASGPVKASVAGSGRRIYVGAYDGYLYALELRTGRLRWRASSHRFLGRHGAFYSTPAVAYGRVYVGSTDRAVYSFGAETGRLRWRRLTGGYVYSSPTVWRQRVFVGSYDGRLYALDAATGAVRWVFEAGGPISGAAVVLGEVVYVSTLREQTFALTAADGRLLWRFPDGKYAAAIGDGERLYLVGYNRLFVLTPK
jgi:outer membrane protein assembly factor BamB